VVLAIDEIIERRRGEKITAKGIYRDPGFGVYFPSCESKSVARRHTQAVENAPRGDRA
jgi:hypothetical protein